MTGFQAANAQSIRDMFSAISSRYDTANTVLSFGLHHHWRRKLVRLSGVGEGAHANILDCASGTGDLAFEFEKAAGDGGQVIGTDFCEDMLKFAKIKAKDSGSHVSFQVADAMALPFESNRFDVVSIAFGIRNVADPAKALSEMARVTRPGGSVLVLEFGQSSVPVWGGLFEFYSKNILPRVGGLVTGRRDAYDYLQVSSTKFPCRERFLDIARETGSFDEMRYVPLAGGVAYIYRLRRRAES